MHGGSRIELTKVREDLFNAVLLMLSYPSLSLFSPLVPFLQTQRFAH